MTELLTSAQMRQIEQAAIDSGAVTGLELMERAGAGVVDAVFEEWPELGQGAHRAVVLCGPGNNGGDGFVVARLLQERGWDVGVFLYGDAEKLPPDARANYELWRKMGAVSSWEDLNAEQTTADLFIDAVFGTGLTRPLPEEVGRELIMTATHDKTTTKVVAVDMPSGLCADSGKMLGGGGDFSDLVVSFHSAKVGHYLDRSYQRCNSLVVKDIGLDHVFDESQVHLVDQARLSDDSCPGISKRKFDHKYTHGHALILSGGFGKTGAARLAARGALRIGAGLVTMGVPGAAQMEVASRITALMLTRVEDAGNLAEVLEDRRLNALCLGPGMGVERARDLVPVALAARHGPRVVLDADALTAYADCPETHFAMLHANCVLTPHGGEFARLFPDIAERLNKEPTRGPAYSKVDATRDAAARAGCVVLFKGADTVIADPNGACSVNAAVYDREAPWLATAGSGDVLAGFITGLLARGFAPMQAAETGAWLHVEAARSFGPGLVAEDLPEELPKVFRRLGL
ncbi:NAD(P)H-hydrate dehydratase [Mameliella alba]|uniref:NAD(P)H-hydrate dehydratase n=1 Tax=Mameliella alba TaxID=561184 RepID=UPI001C942D75|nr:NAD(P)H-hydrate dehydratase [Mameliella alba]MBY6122054.1 NAD(P)H-hydrate dehydratase [Mameliella alba]